MVIDPGEFFRRFLQNYQSDSFAAWYIAKGGLSDHEDMETLVTAAWREMSDSKTAGMDEVS